MSDLNRIIHGDCLDVMRGMDAASVDLVYADPPYCTGRDFGAFDDRWPSREAYLAFMRERLAEMRRLLRPHGSVYLHCDPSISHHLRFLLDDVFGERNFRNEIAWCYTIPGNVRRWFPRKHDSILFYAMGDDNRFNRDAVRIPYKCGAGGAGMFKGKGDLERIKWLELNGKVVEDYWVDTPSIVIPQDYTGLYPTQKPVALLRRIINASSDFGDVVLDPFCGSGTTLVAAHATGRKWIGIDINEDALTIARERLACTTAAML